MTYIDLQNVPRKENEDMARRSKKRLFTLLQGRRIWTPKIYIYLRDKNSKVVHIRLKLSPPPILLL
jgi:hypothetical protein